MNRDNLKIRSLYDAIIFQGYVMFTQPNPQKVARRKHQKLLRINKVFVNVMYSVHLTLEVGKLQVFC